MVRTTTDSGSNFIKALSIFGEQSQSEDAKSDKDQDSSDESIDDYLDTFSILEQDNGFEYQLPTHQRCACHLLNLVATTDADIAEEKNDTYKRLSRAAFGKCQAMWNKSGRSYKAAEINQSHAMELNVHGRGENHTDHSRKRGGRHQECL